MIDYSEEIRNIEQARRYFISMGCSHFHLCRENFQRRDEYYALKISTDLESEWRKEEFEKRVENFHTNEQKDLGWKFSSLASIIERKEFYLEKLLELSSQILVHLQSDQIWNILSTIIGNNGSKSRGGLIQKSYDLKRDDLANKFCIQAKLLLKIADDNSITLTFIRGYFLDVIDYYGIKESKEYLVDLWHKDNSDNFKYFKKRAEEGNKYSMKMLSEYYLAGKGCSMSLEKAKYWELKADE